MSTLTLSSTPLTPTITSLGVGSGLNLNSIVTQLVALEKQPLTQLQAAASTLQTHISDYGQVSSLLSTLQTAATSLQNPTLWSQQTATSSSPGAVGVTVGTGAVSGNYAVNVQSLASAQTVSSSTTYASATDPVGSGSLTLQLGAWSGGAFTPQANSSPTTITVDSTDTVQSLATKINAAGIGVTATLVTDASGVRIALSSSSTGAANGFRVQASDSDGNNTDNVGLSALAYDPAGGANGMTLAMAASNASATINGISIASASNTVSSAVAGLTLTLSQTTTSPVNVAVSNDQNSISTAISSFVSAFNAVASYLGNATAYDASTQTAGDLQGDSAANSLQSLLRSTLTTVTGSSSVFKTLSDVGLQFTRSGTLSVDQTTLNSALNNLPELQKAFSTIDTTTPGNNGFATNFVNFTQQVLGTDGLVTTATSSLNAQLTDNGNQQTALNNRVAAYQKTLVAQYTALDAQLAQLNALSTYVTQQLASLNGNSSSSSKSG